MQTSDDNQEGVNVRAIGFFLIAGAIVWTVIGLLLVNLL